MQNKRLSLSPLQLMQKFYNDYSRQKQYSVQNDQIGTCKYSKNKSNDTDKLTKFLHLYDKRQRGNSTVVSSSHSNNLNKLRTLSPSRYRENQTQIAKRSYFKNSYTQSHPFLVSHHKIKQKQVEELKPIKTQPIEITSSALYNNFKLMTPTENRKSVEEIKQKMMRIKLFKKQRMQKVRYNYLVNNCYKTNKDNQLDIGSFKGSRIRIKQVNTKQRIFPTSVNINANIKQ